MRLCLPCVGVRPIVRRNVLRLPCERCTRYTDRMTLVDYPIAVLVFHADGCESCDAYLPKLKDVAGRWAECTPTLMLDVKTFARLSDEMKIRFTPTTMTVRRGRPFGKRIEGDADTDVIEKFYLSSLPGCEID